MTRIAVTLLVAVPFLLAAARTAHAGWDCSDNHADSIKTIEVYAKNPTAKAGGLNGDDPDFLCADGVAKEFPDRVAKACKTILDRKADKYADDCIDLAALAGLTQVGDHDIFAAISTRKENPFDFPGGFWWPRVGFLGSMADARASAIILKEWQDNAPKAPKKRSSNAVTSWVMWRRDACTALAATGDADTVAFLERELATTTGSRAKVVKASCTGAIVAIKKRLGQ